ncbi:epidermal growth factor receptor kinase substrate 8-like protein 3 isoform 1-T2 [Anomaloglossus baeobatrachus]|uniref:epidermal growth factor receptor kinase substrate 8-like protein 3 n=1 Tax=Anomaloglossus baeobatrachus TaxID=238106 RepID=UPI003F50BA3F
MDQDYLNAIDGVLAQHAESTQPINIGSRPSAKSIYDQRRKYAQSLSNVVVDFHHRVEHLLTCELDNRLRNVQDCLKHLSLLHAEGKIWGQEMILQVHNEELILADLESRESLENIPLQNIENCRAVSGSHPYNSLFVITVRNRRNTNILLFQSDEHPANTLQRKLEKVLSQWKEDQQSRDNTRVRPQSIRTQNEYNERSYSPQPIPSLDSPRLGRSGIQNPQDSPASQQRDEPPAVRFQPPSIPTQKSDTGRDIEVLNHVLTDIEIFVGKLNIDKKKKKEKSVPESEFIACFQKIKYGFNLLAKVQNQMSQPTAPDLVHILMDVLPKIVSKCPGKNTVSSVLTPFLTQKAILLLSACVTDKERKLWDSLGDAWQRTREDWPNGKNVPAYTPIFSDGWIPPAATLSNDQLEIQQSNRTPPTNRHFQPIQMKAAYDFEARNERELSVLKGESLKVLDQSRQWWMVENAHEQRGFVPSNILENTANNQHVRIRPETLRHNSTPEEVADWLQDKGFSRITIRCLGVLRGDQLLDLSRADLKAVCPEEGGRVYSQLSEIRERDLLF